eukprot:3840842-Karenia_brevis.AAC.1
MDHPALNKKDPTPRFRACPTTLPAARRGPPCGSGILRASARRRLPASQSPSHRKPTQLGQSGLRM